MEYFEMGLDKPKEVEDSTKEWRADNDNIGRFIENCCVTGDNFRARAGTFYSAYRDWVERSGERTVASDREFSAGLITRGYKREEDNKGRYYAGIGLRADPPESKAEG
jgi:phage/plasmid-associated DNA primase